MASTTSKKRALVQTTLVPQKKKKVSSKSAVNVTSTIETTEKPDIDDADSPSASSDNVLTQLERDTMGESWRNALSAEFDKPYFRQLKTFLINEQKSQTIYPEASNIYSWSRFTPLEAVKIVVLGQDPYHNVGQAHGLSFSVLPPTKLPGSLRNIYKQIQNDIPSFKPPKTGDLTPLAKAGVLWLNTCLTVRAHTPNSHAKKGWETFTDAVIRAILARESVADLTQLNELPREDAKSTPPPLKADKASRGVVFFAWGLPAQKTFARIGVDETQHLVLRSAHPSPLSASRGFLGNEHFKKANDWLRERYGEGAEIDWSVLHDS